MVFRFTWARKEGTAPAEWPMAPLCTAAPAEPWLWPHSRKAAWVLPALQGRMGLQLVSTGYLGIEIQLARPAEVTHTGLPDARDQELGLWSQTSLKNSVLPSCPLYLT